MTLFAFGSGLVNFCSQQKKQNEGASRTQKAKTMREQKAEKSRTLATKENKKQKKTAVDDQKRSPFCKTTTIKRKNAQHSTAHNEPVMPS